MPIELKIPTVGESITEVEIGEWRKSEGDAVAKDETIVLIESEKANVDLPAPSNGTLAQILKKKGETAAVGEVIAYIEEGAAPKKTKAAETKATETADQKQESAPETKPSPDASEEQSKQEEAPSVRITPAAQRLLSENQLDPSSIQASGPGGRILKEDVMRYIADVQSAEPAKEPAETKKAPQPQQQSTAAGREEEVVPMSRLRKTLAERLVQAQQNAALLTTFNEADMSEVLRLRKEYGESFQKKHGIKLGFMSFFVKAVVDALKQFPAINAEVRGTNIVYRNYYDIGVAVGGGRGLVVPILRNAEQMSFAEVEVAIADLGKRAKENQLKIDELQGGTFTISNGGVYGSLMSTPIVNPPQSGVLGMHSIQERPVVHEGQIVARPMMYLALTYDHRVVDGREAVTFLRRIKEAIETPVRLLMEV